MGLRLRILLPIIGLIVVLMSVSGYFSYSSAYKNLNETLATSLEREAQGFERASTAYMSGSVEDIVRTAETVEVVNFLRGYQDEYTTNAINAFVLNLQKTYPAQEAITLVGKDGMVVYSTKPVLIGKDFSKNGYFSSALQGKAEVSEVLEDRVSRKPMLIASAPVFYGEEVIGVATATIMLEDYYERIVKPITVGQHGYAYVLDPKGTLVLHPNSEWQFNPDAPLVKFYNEMAAATKAGEMTTTVGDGSDYINFYRKEPTSGFTLVLCASHDDIFSGLNSLLAMSVGIASVGILLGALLVFFIISPVVSALRQSVAFANAIAGGNLSGSLNIKRTDEIGQLGHALRTIPQVLQNIMAEYGVLRKKIQGGDLAVHGKAEEFNGEFSQLMAGTNAILDQYRTVLDVMPSAVIVYDGDFKALYCNSAAQEMVGGSYIGKTASELLSREDADTADDAFAKAVKSKHSSSADTKAIAAGAPVYISYTCIPLVDENGRINSVLQLVTDLTERVEVQRIMTEVAEDAQGISVRVAEASAELSGRIDEVSHGAKVQSDRSATTAVAMDEMSATIIEIARNAAQANEQASFTHEKASNGTTLVDEVVRSIVQINTLAQDLETDMNHLGEQAVAVGSVMEVISSIADQTNLLALNAAIEAARAGDAGRGFAVVADEVRKLAEQTMSATTDVEQSIMGIQSSAQNNIAKVASTSSEVAHATTLAQESGSALREILELANENSVLISSIATAAEEQAATSEEISRAVDEINVITGETDKGMEQSAGAVAELSQMAQNLNELLNRLRMQ